MRAVLTLALVTVLVLSAAASGLLADTVLYYSFQSSTGEFVNAPEFIAPGLAIGPGPGWDPTGSDPHSGPGNGGGAALYARGFNGTGEAMTLVNFTVETGASLELTGYHFDLFANASAGDYFTFYVIPVSPGAPGVNFGSGVPIVRDSQFHTFTPASGTPGVLPVTLPAGQYNIAISYGRGTSGGFIGLDNFTLEGVATPGPVDPNDPIDPNDPNDPSDPNDPNTPQGPQGVQLGAGSYTTTLPAGRMGPSNSAGNPVQPKRTANVTGPMPTGDWWSSLGWAYFVGDPQAPYSALMQADPLAFQAQAAGLNVCYPTNVSLGLEYHYGFSKDLTIGVAGLSATLAKVDGFSDWTVTGYWSSGNNVLRATFGHGLPFVYCTKSGGAAQIAFASTPTIWHNQNGVIAATVNGHHYAIFGPTGSSWTGTTTLQSDLAGKDYFSLALLPDNTTATLNFYKQYAYAFVTDTRVNWSYDQASCHLTTSYEVTTSAKEGATSETLLALYRHQWLYAQESQTSYGYVSARGAMKVRAGSSFSTVMTFHGVLPSLPDRGTYDRATLYNYVDAVHGSGDSVPPGLDTYWTGKALGRAAALVPIADQVGHAAARDHFLNDIKGALQDWFTYTENKAEDFFYYDSSWGALIGYPASYGSDRELNDHHFHYGYFLMAAAMVAGYEPDWVLDENWGGMLKLVARDAGGGDRNDPLFPRLRNFDPYAGHSWAAGHGAFGAGNNQESASEAMNFATGLILLGSAMGDTEMRDRGIYLYTTEAAAIDQYWYDIDQQVFPAGYNRAAIAILWGNGAAYATWFSGTPEAVHGITFLPITGGSLYLGLRTDYVLRNYNYMVAQNGGPEDAWFDIMWSYQALADPAAAVAKFAANPNYTPEEGETRAHTYHWLHNLNALGQVDSSVTADVPTYAVFNHNGQRTYIAYNAGGATITVHFSDGTQFDVAPRAMMSRPCPASLLDVSTFIAVILGSDTDPLHACQADLNGDGHFDGRDIQSFVTAMLAR
jgi:endoglucanase Acf2